MYDCYSCSSLFSCCSISDMKKYAIIFLGFILGFIFIKFVVVPIELKIAAYFVSDQYYLEIIFSMIELLIVSVVSLCLYHFEKSPVIGLMTYLGFILGYTIILYEVGGFHKIFQSLPLVFYFALVFNFYFALRISKKTAWLALAINVALIGIWGIFSYNGFMSILGA